MKLEWIFSLRLRTAWGLLPVAGVVVRSGDAADLEAFVLVLVLPVSLEVDDELAVETLEKVVIRHAGLEQRDLDTGDHLHDRVHLDSLTARERDVGNGVDDEAFAAGEEGVFYGERGADGEHEGLALTVELEELFIGDLAVLLADGGGVGHGD